MEFNLSQTTNNNINFKFSNSNLTEKQLENLFVSLNTFKSPPTFDGSTLKNDREFNKGIVKCYKKLCNLAIEKSSDYNFLRSDFYIEIPEVNNILLNVMFNEKLSSQDIIKYVKGIELTLTKIISLERILMDFYMYEYIKSNLDESEELVKLMMFLNTLFLIKYIKFGLSKYDIDYFDDNYKPKKIYTGLKMVCSDSGLIHVLNKNIASYKNIVAHIRNLKDNKAFYSNNEDDGYRFYQYVFDNSVTYLTDLGNSSLFFSIDYLKLILKEDFKSVLNIDNIISHPQTPIVFIRSKAFFERKVLIPKSGVVLLIKNHSILESILIKEIALEDGTHNMIVIAKLKDGTEVPNVIVLQNKLGEHSPHFIVDSYKNEDVKINQYLFDFLGIDRENPLNPSLEYDVISPVYWKYRHKNYISQNDIIKDGIVIKREFEIEIAPYLRKINGEASKEAKTLAKKLCIDLEEGYTIVRPHTRVYNKVK